MKKVIALILSFSILSFDLAFAEAIGDSLALKLDKSLKVEQAKYIPIEDDFVKRTLNPSLKVEKKEIQSYQDNFANKTLSPDLKVQKFTYSPFGDNLSQKLDKKAILSKPATIVKSNIYSKNKIKVSPQKYYTTRTELYEGAGVAFVLDEDAKIQNVVYRKGTKIKARVETLSQNGAYGVPADLVIGNFTLPDNSTLNGQIELQGANRSLWVYPLGYTLTLFFFLGLPVFTIRGGHAKLKPHRVYEIEI